MSYLVISVSKQASILSLQTNPRIQTNPGLQVRPRLQMKDCVRVREREGKRGGMMYHEVFLPSLAPVHFPSPTYVYQCFQRLICSDINYCILHYWYCVWNDQFYRLPSSPFWCSKFARMCVCMRAPIHIKSRHIQGHTHTEGEREVRTEGRRERKLVARLYLRSACCQHSWHTHSNSSTLLCNSVAPR